MTCNRCECFDNSYICIEQLSIIATCHFGLEAGMIVVVLAAERQSKLHI